ncbi:hypothetical protein DFH08DRAFT_1079837 [Mycena albidolilacea]|uniref:Uncharacterized protein n=1 Tax=Mycena albidolilacea TaxID=1033008 RepID=A0AAD7ESZ7_9AGAR|nr:hypothetical protein DFH08DRAFT_1079837 [Mycena albidolilacea]
MDTMNSEHASQNGIRYNFTSHSTVYDDRGMPVPSSDSYFDDSQTVADSDDPALLLARSLPGLQCKVALIQHAGTLQNHQLLLEVMSMCTSIQSTVTTLRKATLDTAKFSTEQKFEMNAACRAVFFTGRLTDFDNEILKPEVVTYLKKYMDTNGFKLFFEDKSHAHSKVIFVQVGRSLSGIKSFFRRSVLKSLPDDKGSIGCGLTDFANTMAKKCLKGAENVKAKHAIWLLIIRSFVLTDAELRTAPAEVGNVDDDDAEFPAALLPAKRTHSGTVKTQTSDGKLIAAFWDRAALLWKRKNKEFGTADLKSEAWTGYINACVVQEKKLFPNDALALIVGSGAAVAPPTGPSVNRLSGLPNHSMPNEVGGSRQALMPRMFNGQQPPATFGSRTSTLDHLMNTPTNFTGVPSGAGLHLPALNMLGSGRDSEGARYQTGRSTS